MIMFAAAFGVAFAGTWVLYSDEPDKARAPKAAAAAAAPTKVDAVDQAGVLASPMTGNAIAMTDAPDAVFASLAMGNGAVVEPTAGEVYSPVTGTVTMLFDTKHAIGLAAADGTEVLIHIGVDTVELAGGPFTAHVAAGDAVKAGQILVILEAMKIENEIVAPKDGTVAQIVVKVGEKVDTGAALVVLA
jgi:PTS system sucrose-specific IIC component